MKQIQLTADPAANFTPRSLMYRYAGQHPAVGFRSGPYGEAQLVLGGRAWRYHHWSIAGACVTLFLEEVEP